MPRPHRNPADLFSLVAITIGAIALVWAAL